MAYGLIFKGNRVIKVPTTDSSSKIKSRDLQPNLALWCLIALVLIVRPSETTAEPRLTSENLAKIDVSCSEQRVEPMGPTRKILDPKRPFLVDVGPYQFTVPWEYFLGRPKNYLPSCKRDNYTFLSVQYWIPDGRAPEKDYSARPELQPAEANRPNPKADEWLIQATQLEYFDQEPRRRFDADKRYAVIIERSGFEATADEETGTIRLTNGKTFNYYYINETNYSTLIGCHIGVLDPNWVGRRVCFAELVFRDLKLSGRLMLPVDSIKYHSVIVATLKTLLEEWMLK